MGRYASTTSVGVAKSRGEIDALLRQWGCDGIRWTDQHKIGLVQVEFTWEHDDTPYLARFSIQLPDDAELRKRSQHASQHYFLESKYQKLCADNGKVEHRILLLFLKAAFNAVEEGIIDAQTLFLPYLVGADGRTVAEVALPRLSKMLEGGAASLLQLPEGS